MAIVIATVLAVVAPGIAAAQLRRPQAGSAQEQDTFKVSYFDTGTASTASFKLGIGGDGIGGAGDSLVRIVNPTSQPFLCAMIYVFDEAEELQECCGCPVSADGLLPLSVENNLTANPAAGSGRFPTGIISLVSSAPNDANAPGGCNPAAAPVVTPTLRAWATHVERSTGGAVGDTVDEFAAVPPDDKEFTELASTCATILQNGTGAGVCNCGEPLPPPPPPPPIQGSCATAGALGILISGKDVDVYAPDSSISEASGFVHPAPFSTTGIQLVPIEGGHMKATIATTGFVNSCASDDMTGETVCAGNDNKVYLIAGSTLSATLTSGAFSQHVFSGGACANCGVVVDAGSDTAILGVSLPGSTTGYQLLDLSKNTFATPIPAGETISETIGLDPSRHLILSPSEDVPVYQLVNIATPGSPQIFNNPILFNGGQIQFDSAGEECTTGILLGTDETHPDLYIADLSQAKFTPGSPGSWTAPAQLQSLPDFSVFTQGGTLTGTTGIAVASGAHLAVLEDEFGTTAFGVVQLPSTSGFGTPSIQDWVVANMPDTPDGVGWLMGFDAHGVSAYVSPNSNKAIGVIINRQRTFLALIDLAALLKAPRTTAGGHVISPSVDLVKSGIVTFVAIH